MKSLIVFFVFGFSLAIGTAQEAEEEMMSQVRLQSGIDFQSVDQLRNAPPQQAWRFFGGLARGYGDEPAGNNLTRRAGRAIAINEAVENYIRQKMKSIPHDFYTSSDRNHYIKPLGYIPAPWSLRLLGEYLMDETPMSPGSIHDDYDGGPNSSHAAFALLSMGFSDGTFGPTEPGMIERWRQWWKQNESRIDERIREINPDYQPVSAPPVPSLTTMPKPSPSASASPPATRPPAEPSRNSVSASATPPKNFLLSAAGAIGLLLLIVGALVWFSRRR